MQVSPSLNKVQPVWWASNVATVSPSKNRVDIWTDFQLLFIFPELTLYPSPALFIP